jgi:hypothetical protein
MQAQRKIEEMIRQEQVLENMAHAMEYSVSELNCPVLYFGALTRAGPLELAGVVWQCLYAL